MYPLLVFVGALAFYLPFNAHIPITDPVESNYALTAKEMFISGNWLSPQIYGQFWYDKPAMIYWLIAASYKLLGVGEFAARLPSAVFSAASVAFSCWFSTRLFNSRAAGIFTAVVLGTSLEFWVLARMVITDAVLFFFSSVSLAAIYLGASGQGKGWFVLAYASAGLAVLTKGPVGLVLPAIIIFAYIFVTRRWRLISHLYIIPGIAIFLAVAAPWYYAMYQEHGKAFIDSFLGLHNYLRATVSEHPKDNVFYYYLVLFPVSLLPWTGLLLRSLAGRRLPHFPFLAVWGGVTIVFYTLMATKYPTYVFPASFPAAVLIGRELEQMRHTRARSWLWLTLPSLLLLGAIGIGTKYLPSDNWMSLYVLIAISAASILWLQIRGEGWPLAGVVGLSVVAIALLLISHGLIPLAEARSAKTVVRALPPDAVEITAFGDYPTSAVFYSGRKVTHLVQSADVSDKGVWSGKYTMPTETVASFSTRTANIPGTYVIVSDDLNPPFKDSKLIGTFERMSLYQRPVTP